MDTKTLSYEAPEVKVIEIEIERGFSVSGNSVSGWDDGGEFEGTFMR